MGRFIGRIWHFNQIICNRYLQFENIRDAALANDFTRIQIGYNKNGELAADRAAANKGRQNFIAIARA